MTNNVFITSFIDDWETMSEEDTVPTKEPEYFEFESDPLALTCAMLRNGKEPYDISTTLVGVASKNMMFDHVIEKEDQEHADTIRKHFSKKHTMRRLKNEFVSSWMSEVDAICEEPRRLKKECVPILVTLPRFYKENLVLDNLMKTHKSAPTTYNIPFKQDLEFVEKVHRVSKRNNHFDYYWKTKNGYLIRFRTNTPEYGETAWDAISKNRRIHVTSNDIAVTRIQGYDFNIIVPSSMAKLELL